MIDLINLENYDNNTDALFQRLKPFLIKHSVFCDEDTFLSKGYFEKVSKKTSPWFLEYFNLSSMEEFELLATGVIKPTTTAGNNLLGKMKRMLRTDLNFKITNSNYISDPFSTLIRILNKIIEFDNEEVLSTYTEPQFREHIVSFIYKFSDKGRYQYDKLYANTELYKREESLELSDETLEAIVISIKGLQKALGIKDVIDGVEPKLQLYSWERANDRARTSNNSAALSFPTYLNSRNKKANETNIELGKILWEDPTVHGLLPATLQSRLQQGGNILKDLLMNVNPNFEYDRNYPTEDMILEAIDTDDVLYGRCYFNDEPTVHSVCRKTKLPMDDNARRNLVDSGSDDPIILNKNKKGKYSQNWRVEFPNIFNLPKHRTVFAFSGPLTLATQRIIYPVMDYLTSYVENNGTYSYIAGWFKKVLTSVAMTKSISSHVGTEDAYGSKPILDTSDREFTVVSESEKENLAMNDKSGFDGYQPSIISALVVSCLLAPLFSNSEKELDVLMYACINGTNSSLITPTDLFKFMSIIGSGAGITGLLGTLNSATITDSVKIENFIRNKKLNSETAMEKLQKVYKAIGYPQHLGDDTMDHLPNDDVSSFESDFRKYGYILHLGKSMISKHSAEFLRNSSSGTWRYKDDSGLNLYASSYPPFHAFIGDYFYEQSPPKSPALGSLATMARLDNLSQHPNFRAICDFKINEDKLRLGTKRIGYMTLRNLSLWEAAGSKETEKDKYSVIIESPRHLVDLAQQDADFLDSNISSSADLPWLLREQNLSVEDWKNIRVNRILTCINDEDEDELSRLLNQVHKETNINQ